MSDQPPGVDPDDPESRPHPRDAAARVLEFVGWFGDGLIAGDPYGFPLYARDLEAVATAQDITPEQLDALLRALYDHGVPAHDLHAAAREVLLAIGVRLIP